jgi:hypothetical protein
MRAEFALYSLFETHKGAQFIYCQSALVLPKVRSGMEIGHNLKDCFNHFKKIGNHVSLRLQVQIHVINLTAYMAAEPNKDLVGSL